MSEKVIKSEQEWKQETIARQYQVTRQAGTERAFTGKYWNTKDKGTYNCGFAVESLCSVRIPSLIPATGWPSFL